MKHLEYKGRTIGRNFALGAILCMSMAQPLFANGITPAAHEISSGVIAGAEEVTLSANGDRQMFEQDLQRFAGTYAIYSWLPEQDQADIYRASRDGASMKNVRKMVITKRRMHY